MNYKKIPQHFEDILSDYMVIGYVDDNAIIINESKELFYLPCEKGIFDIGTVVENELLRPIKELSEDMQLLFHSFIQEVGTDE